MQDQFNDAYNAGWRDARKMYWTGTDTIAAVCIWTAVLLLLMLAYIFGRMTYEHYFPQPVAEPQESSLMSMPEAEPEPMLLVPDMPKLTRTSTSEVVEYETQHFGVSSEEEDRRAVQVQVNASERYREIRSWLMVGVLSAAGVWAFWPYRKRK